MAIKRDKQLPFISLSFHNTVIKGRYTRWGIEDRAVHLFLSQSSRHLSASDASPCHTRRWQTPSDVGPCHPTTLWVREEGGREAGAGWSGEQTSLGLFVISTEGSRWAFIMKLLFSAASRWDSSNWPHRGGTREPAQLFTAPKFKWVGCDFLYFLEHVLRRVGEKKKKKESPSFHSVLRVIKEY